LSILPVGRDVQVSIAPNRVYRDFGFAVPISTSAVGDLQTTPKIVSLVEAPPTTEEEAQ